jgi:hypothetical protein
LVSCFWQRRPRHLGRAGGVKLFGLESQALQHPGWSLFSGVVLLFGFRVFGNCAGCAKLKAGGQNLDSDSETKQTQNKGKRKESKN